MVTIRIRNNQWAPVHCSALCIIVSSVLKNVNTFPPFPTQPIHF